MPKSYRLFGSGFQREIGRTAQVYRDGRLEDSPTAISRRTISRKAVNSIMIDPPSRLGVLTDQYLMTHEVEALERVVEKTGVEIPLVLVNDPADPDIDPGLAATAINDRIGIDTVRVLLKVLRTEGAWAFVYAERKLFEELGSTVPSMGRVNVEDVTCLSESDIRHVTPITDGTWSELPLEAVDLVRERSDVAIRFGYGLLKGDVLQAPKFGVLSYHPADIRVYRGLGVPQAWVDGRNTMGMTLQRLNEQIDAGEVIAYGETDVTDCATIWDAYEKVHTVKTDLLAEGINNLRDPSWEPTVVNSLGPYYSVKKLEQPTFAARVLLKNLTGRLRRLAGGA